MKEKDIKYAQPMGFILLFRIKVHRLVGRGGGKKATSTNETIRAMYQILKLSGNSKTQKSFIIKRIPKDIPSLKLENYQNQILGSVIRKRGPDLLFS